MTWALFPLNCLEVVHSLGLLVKYTHSLTHSSGTRPCRDESILAGTQELPDNTQGSAEGVASAWGTGGEGYPGRASWRRQGLNKVPRSGDSEACGCPEGRVHQRPLPWRKGQGLVLKALLAAAASLMIAN